MEKNFEQLIASLQVSSLVDDGLYEIKCILDKQNSEIIPSFISQLHQSILILEHWAWQVLSQNFHQWIKEVNYLELFHTIALFNRHLISIYDTIEVDVKASLLIPDTIDWINGIFDQLKKTTDENDPLISITSLWFDNLSFFLYNNPEFTMSDIINYISDHMASNYIMTDQYKIYLTQLRQSSLSQSIFTAKQLFYIKTCSSCLSSYLFATASNFHYTASDMIRHFGADHVKIVILHSYDIESWSTQLLTCITYLMAFFSSCCWWGGEKGSQGGMAFPTELTVCEYVDAIIRIINYKPFYQSISTQLSNDETILLDIAIFGIIDVAQYQDFIWFLRSKVLLPKTLIAITEMSICDSMCLGIYQLLCEILNDERLKELKISDNVSSLFFNMLEQAWHHPSKKYKQIPIFHLLKAFVSLSKIDAVQQKAADTDKISLLIEMCDEYKIIFNILWALSFNHDIKQQLRSNTSLMSKLTDRPKECDNQKTRKIIHGLLWNLESTHNDSILLPNNNEKKFEIMISYSHRDQIICRRIYEELVNTGFSIWIDFDNIHGNVMDAMAEAIDKSCIVLICMSEHYRRSNFCRAEAQYAFQRRLKMVPVIIQEHYEPDGWLLFLVGQLLYVDFTKYEFSKTMKILVKELQTTLISGINVKDDCLEKVNVVVPVTSVSQNSLSLPLLPENMLDWTQKHVRDWLISHGLLQISRIFANLDGRSLIYMYEVIENVELQQVVSLLHEESLRRTNQSLSLVEFSYFRSLMDQQQRSLTSPIVTNPRRINLQKEKHKNSVRCPLI